MRENPKTVDIKVSGYRYILTIEYGYFKISKALYLVWRVRGTDHVFRIPLKDVTMYCRGDYPKHFIDTLLKFRDDLIIWENGGLSDEWMRDYWEQFEDLIQY